MSFQTIIGNVIHGEKVGRTIGFPTANLDVKLTETDLTPGVYLCKITLVTNNLQPATYNGLAYFGPRYIFDQQVNSFEVYLYNFSGDLYDQKVHVELTTFIREPMNLNTVEKLKEQLEKDKQFGLELIGQQAVY
jgi:riboflavin kinase/FMN adenylyltransferase